jgi:hypothetical protein
MDQYVDQVCGDDGEEKTLKAANPNEGPWILVVWKLSSPNNKLRN